MANEVVAYQGSQKKGLFSAAVALFTGQSSGSTPFSRAPTRTLDGTTTVLGGFALRLAGSSHQYNDGNNDIKTDDKSLADDHYVCTSDTDSRNNYAKSHSPFFPLTGNVGLALMYEDPWAFAAKFITLSSTIAKKVPSPKYPSMEQWQYDIQPGELTDEGVGKYALVDATVQVTAIDKQHLIPFARQVIDRGISDKLNAQEKRLLGYVRTENDPLLIAGFHSRLKPVYVFVPSTERVNDVRGLRDLLDARPLTEVFDNLASAARFAYEKRDQSFSLLEIFTLNVTSQRLPAALQAKMITARALASLSSDEKSFLEEQRAIREIRMRNRYTRIEAQQGADETQSTIKSHYIWLTIDSSESLRGSVMAGKFTNRTLRSMASSELFELHRECKSDAGSKELCEIYLDYISPKGWKNTSHSDFTGAANEITLDQAYTTLGLNNSATPQDIKRAYRRMVQKTHPDHGGNAEQFERVIQAMTKLRTDRHDFN